jgi:phasin family protein
MDDNQFGDQINRATDAANKTAQASRRTLDESGRAASQIAEHAARAHEQMAHRAADAGMRGAGIVKATIESGVEAAAHGFERIADHFTTAMGFAGPEAERLAAQSRENLDAISQANSVIIKGAEDMSHQWMTVAKETFAKNFDALARVGECRSLQAFAALQSELWRDNMSRAVEGGKRAAEIYAKTNQEAADRVRMQRAA